MPRPVSRRSVAAATVQSTASIVRVRRHPASLAQESVNDVVARTCAARFESVSAPRELSHVDPSLVLVLVCLARFIVILDATIVDITLRTFSRTST